MDAREVKPIRWLSERVSTPPFSAEARREAGELLRRVQNGDRVGMPHSRPLPSIGPRCHELRVRDADANWRIVYRIDPDAILIVAVFPKRTEQTPRSIIDGCRRRLAEYDTD